MVYSLALYAASYNEPDAKSLLLDVEKHYRGLASFSMNIEHHDSSGLYPGEYKQRLRWVKGKKFDLVITSPSNYTPKDGQTGGRAASFYSNGSEVIGIQPTGNRSIHPVAPDKNTMPGWEVSGGFILSWLMDTPSGLFFGKPPKGFNLAYSFGTEKTWRESSVREIALAMAIDGQNDTMKASFYIAEKEPKLLGFQFAIGAQSGWAEYKDQVENPKFESEVGELPKLLSRSL